LEIFGNFLIFFKFWGEISGIFRFSIFPEIFRGFLEIFREFWKFFWRFLDIFGNLLEIFEIFYGHFCNFWRFSESFWTFLDFSNLEIPEFGFMEIFWRFFSGEFFKLFI
jgi:hypothetical protein